MTTYSCFPGRTVAIIGGAQGIGKACAILFARQGARVFVADVNAEMGEALREEIRQQGGLIEFVRIDATDPGQVRSFAEQAGAAGEVPYLVNCQGGFSKYTPALEVDDDDWDRTIRLNLTSIFYACREFGRRMKDAGKGSIVNISSLAGRTFFKETTIHYCAAKAAVESMTRVLAGELGPHGIRVNAVAPGSTKSERVVRLRGEEQLAAIGKTLPRGQVASTEDIARAVLFLCSDEAAHITGVSLDVNGGQWMS